MKKPKGIEVECVDCGADIIAAEGSSEPRCDTCQEHHDGLCGEDYPIREHDETKETSP